MKYIIEIDQSARGTKALLFDEQARLLGRTGKNHRQAISHERCISHHPEELYENTLKVVRRLVEEQRTPVEDIYGIGISNQRETTVMREKEMGQPVCDVIVWRCARAERVYQGFIGERKEYIAANTGIPPSSYFPTAKMSWVLKHYEEVGKLAEKGQLLAETVDSWLLCRLVGRKEHEVDYFNASRAQLFNLHTLLWDEQIRVIFGIPVSCLPEAKNSSSLFGMTDLEGLANREIPIHTMMGDSYGTLYGQGCHQLGMVRAIYGTGSSLMMNVSREFIDSSHRIMTSLAWGIDDQVDYVLEENLNYTGTVISRPRDDLQLIESAGETENLARSANRGDTTYLVPVFSELGVLYQKSDGKVTIYGMNRGTRKKEIVRAALNYIIYQITDVLKAMGLGSGMTVEKLCVDDGSTRNGYLIQFQSDMGRMAVAVPDAEELSGMGAAYLAEITMGMSTEEQSFFRLQYRKYRASMDEKRKHTFYEGWLDTVGRVLSP